MMALNMADPESPYRLTHSQGEHAMMDVLCDKEMTMGLFSDIAERLYGPADSGQGKTHRIKETGD